MLRYEVIGDPSDLEDLRVEWDQLAIAARNPLNVPAAFFAWLEHLAPADRDVRAILVRDGSDLVGLTVFNAARRHGMVAFEPHALGSAWIPPLAAPGREWEVTGQIWHALAEVSPRPDAVTARGPAGGWSLPWQMAEQVMPARRRVLWPPGPVIVWERPVIDLSGGWEAWFMGRSRNFREDMRRAKKRLEKVGASFRQSTSETLEQDIGTLFRFHLTRFEGRQSSLRQERERLQATLVTMARELSADRMRVNVLDLDGEPIFVGVCFAAGGEAVGWNHGWNESHRQLHPGVAGLLNLVEQAASYGDTCVDLGPGTMSYKRRFATGTSLYVSSTRWVRHPWRQYAQWQARTVAEHLLDRVKRRAQTTAPKPPSDGADDPQAQLRS